MAVCYTNNMDDLVLLYERVDSGSVYVHLHQKVQPALSNLTVSYMKIPHKLCLVLACLLLALLLLLLFLACNSRLHSAIRLHHPPQRAVLSQICCFRQRKVVLFQILLDGAEPRDAEMT